MKINWGQVAVSIISTLFCLGIYLEFTKENTPEVEYVYMTINSDKRVEYILSEKKLFLRDSSSCVTDGIQDLKCGITYLSLQRKN